MSKTKFDFTTESTTLIYFPSDRQFVEFREEIESRYSGAMVRVTRYDSFRTGVVARLDHATGLGAELRGFAYGHFDGHTVRM